MRYAVDYICAESRMQLVRLCDILKWANECDGKGFLPSAYSSTSSVYGHVQRAIIEIVGREAGVNLRFNMPDWGANATWFDDLMTAVDILLNDANELARNEHSRQ